MAGWGEGRLAARPDPLSVGHLLAMAPSRLPQRLLSAMDSTRRFFVFRNSEPFHLVVGGTSLLVGEWAPLLCHRLRDFLVEAGRKKKPAAPQGIPRRSPTPVLTGPCVA